MARTKFLVGLLVVLAVGLAVGGYWCFRKREVPAPRPTTTPAPTPRAGFVGSKSCRECHAEFYQSWATSHHGLAMQPYTAEFAQKDLAPQQAEVTIGRRTYRAEIAAQQGWVRERGPDGEHRHPIAHVMGGKNVYYLLTPRERGRLQVLPVAYDVQKKSWYDTAASGVRHFPDRRDVALDWTDRMFTFNTACFSCHVSELATNYDLASDTYETTWSEPGISCESCHGPAGEHVRAMRKTAPGTGSAAPPPAEHKNGHPAAVPVPVSGQQIKIIRTREFTTAQMNDMCATCHAKMVPLSSAFRPGDKFFDHFDLITLEHPDFYPDGRDLGENYTHTSWLMGPCAKSGKLDCNHCHTPSGRPRFTGENANRLCLPCHEAEVNGAAGHSRHQAGSKGSECIPCHMPMTRFAAMGRSDHSMRPPAPAATVKFNSPNACNLCHADHDAAWADEWVRKWYPNDYQAEILRQAELIDAARKGQWQRLPEMLAELARPDGDVVRKTSLVRLLRGSADERKWPALVQLLKDPSPLVRSSAASALGDHRATETIKALLAAARDESRLVRIRAAMALAAVPAEWVPDERDRHGLQNAIGEFQTAMRARPDDWASYANLGNFAMERRDFPGAIQYFETSHKLEPRIVGPMVNAAIAYSNLGQNDKAEASLRRALKAEPANAAANFNLGLLLGEKGRLAEAEQTLRAALKADPQMAAAAYNLGVIVGKRDVAEAIRWCQQAWQLLPSEPKYGQTLAFYQREKGDTAGAAKTLRQVIDRHPLYLDAYLLLGEIYQSHGGADAAAALFREALSKEGWPPAIRQQLEAKVAAPK